MPSPDDSARTPLRFEPTLESLRSHTVPTWFHDAKLGIFMHWSLSSVPAFAPRGHDIHDLLRDDYWNSQPRSPYSEWYENSLRFPGSPVATHHARVWGNRPYRDFQALWEAGLENWDPDAWAREFAAAGARYFVLVAKHHDGYCLWPSRVANPHRAGWFSKRDVVGELGEAVRRQGLRFGIYYSGGIDWTFNPAPLRTPADFLASIPGGDYPAYAEAQTRELIDRYAPDVLWNDIAWPGERDDLFALFADYYEAVPDGLVNDRWITPNRVTRALRWRPVRWLADALVARSIRKNGASLQPPPPPFCDVRTPEYTSFGSIQKKKWECVRGIDSSFGYNRESLPEDHLSKTELLESFVDMVSKNGNLLLNVGPRGEDATIPEIQSERLRWLGAFLDREGDALYGTRPWQRAEATTRRGTQVRFTQKEGRLFALFLAPKPGSETLPELEAESSAVASTLGGESLPLGMTADGLEIELPDSASGSPVMAVEVRGVREREAAGS